MLAGKVGHLFMPNESLAQKGLVEMNSSYSEGNIYLQKMKSWLKHFLNHVEVFIVNLKGLS